MNFEAAIRIAAAALFLVILVHRRKSTSYREYCPNRRKQQRPNAKQSTLKEIS